MDTSIMDIFDNSSFNFYGMIKELNFELEDEYEEDIELPKKLQNNFPKSMFCKL